MHKSVLWFSIPMCQEFQETLEPTEIDEILGPSFLR